MLAQIRKEKNFRKKASLLKIYAHSRDNLPELKQFLETELGKTHSKEWKTCCKRWLVWVDHNLLSKMAVFDPKDFLAQMKTDRSLEEKVFLINSFLKFVNKEHKAIIAWFADQLETHDPKLRAVARKVVEHFKKKGILGEEIKPKLFMESRPSLNLFLQSRRDTKLEWLHQALSLSGRKTCLYEWGVAALCFEQDEFVLSLLVKVLPEIFVTQDFDLSRLVSLMEGFLWHEDARLRANTLEGLSILNYKHEVGARIQEVFQNFLQDPDERVCTAALLGIHQTQPDTALENLREILRSMDSLEAVEPFHWLLEKEAEAHHDLRPLEVLARKKLEQIRVLSTEEELESLEEEEDEAVIAQLERLEIFTPLDREDLVNIASQIKVLELPSESLIIREGDSGNSLFVITIGEVAVQIEREGDDPLELARLSEGICFGEMSLLTGEPRTASVVSTAECQLIEVPKKALEPVIRSRPELGRQLAEIMAHRKAKTQEMVDSEDQASVEAVKTYAKECLGKIRSFFGIKIP
jgi:CRP-like cAMP-binding protein